MEKLLKVEEVCDLLQVSRSLVYKWVHYSFVPYVKIGALIRFRKYDLERWIKVKAKKGRKSYKVEINV